jgi:CheY-like chemotaxis protein
MKDKNFLIVIADDDLDDQYIIQQAIKETSLPHTISLVKNGLELMDLLQKRGSFAESSASRPDLVIMDLNMPLMDGYGVLKIMKSEEGLRDIPIYVLSTSRFEYDKLKTLEYGANDFFSKPYHFEDLKVIIKDICSKTLEFAGSK